MRLDLEANPLPLVTNSRRPSGVTRTEVGYHPVGMNPIDRLRPGCRTSKTAIALMLAFETKSKDSSGLRATLLGVEPGGESGSSSEARVSTQLPPAVSRTLMVLRLALATNRKLPARLRTISFGCSCTAHRASLRPELSSNTPTSARPQ